MADFIKLFKTSDLAKGSKKAVFVGGKRLVVANIEGTYFAMDDTCTHAGCSLGSEGYLEGKIITCGCHGGQFDITTGKVVSLPPTVDEHTYEVKVEGDDVMVAI